MSGGEILTARQARQLLQLPEGAGIDEVRRAYRLAVRAAHPDHGGDAEALRRVIDAHRLLTNLHIARRHLVPMRVTTPKPRPAILTLTIAEAMAGASKTITLADGRQGRAAVPAGMRHGEHLRVKTPAGSVLFKVRIFGGPVEVRGDDLWMIARVGPEALTAGSRVEIDTGAGRKSVWISAEAGRRGLARLPDQGLPRRGERPQGHLFLKLQIDPALARSDDESRARSMLRRFAASWAA